jgi:chloramphenicol 3-O-phosphotransferase
MGSIISTDDAVETKRHPYMDREHSTGKLVLARAVSTIRAGSAIRADKHLNLATPARLRSVIRYARGRVRERELRPHATVKAGSLVERWWQDCDLILEIALPATLNLEKRFESSHLQSIVKSD